MRRRELGLGFLGGLLAACSRKAPPGASTPPSARSAPGASNEAERWRTLVFPPSDALPEGQEALAFTPPEAKTWPTLVALHGRGEAGRGLAIGARGWRDDYAVEAMHERLRAPPLSSKDVGGFLDEERLSALNRSLTERPYEGVVLSCPYTPIVTDPTPAGAASFADFVVSALLPKVAEATGRPMRRASTGIDGVSMGGRLALLVGLTRPETFGSIGALQPAIHVDEAAALAELARTAMARASFALRLVSSEDDPFLEAVRALSKALDEARVPHRLVVTRGPHDYVWNRGPGACEMLTFHERALRGLAPP